jgi:cyclohexyl-isocyanide hydratase
MSVPLFVSERSNPKITTQPLCVGCLIFERMDQLDFTGPFEVLSRMPDTSIQIIGKESCAGARRAGASTFAGCEHSGSRTL